MTQEDIKRIKEEYIAQLIEQVEAMSLDELLEVTQEDTEVSNFEDLGNGLSHYDCL